jgi:peroxiredoxin
MAFRLPTRRLAAATLARPQPFAAAAAFHASARRAVSAGQEIPSLEVLVEDSPGNKVNLAEELKGGSGLIIGVPAAFSGACSNSHVPSFMNHPKLKSVGPAFVVSVNDAFV